jgi:hypothetical protein
VQLGRARRRPRSESVMRTDIAEAQLATEEIIWTFAGCDINLGPAGQEGSAAMVYLLIDRIDASRRSSK